MPIDAGTTEANATVNALFTLPLQYFAPSTPPSTAHTTGQKLASTSDSQSDLVAAAPHAIPQLTILQRLAPAPITAYGLPYEAFDHV